jgi:hypothetical protein
MKRNNKTMRAVWRASLFGGEASVAAFCVLSAAGFGRGRIAGAALSAALLLLAAAVALSKHSED